MQLLTCRKCVSLVEECFIQLLVFLGKCERWSELHVWSSCSTSDSLLSSERKHLLCAENLPAGHLLLTRRASRQLLFGVQR